jgi:hypothetical protein
MGAVAKLLFEGGLLINEMCPSPRGRWLSGGSGGPRTSLWLDSLLGTNPRFLGHLLIR